MWIATAIILPWVNRFIETIHHVHLVSMYPTFLLVCNIFLNMKFIIETQMPNERDIHPQKLKVDRRLLQHVRRSISWCNQLVEYLVNTVAFIQPI